MYPDPSCYRFKKMLLDLFSSQQEWQNFIDTHLALFSETLKDSKTEDPHKEPMWIDLLADENIWPFLLACLSRQLKMPLLILTQSSEKASEIESDIKCIDTQLKPVHFPYIPLSDIGRHANSNLDLLAKRLHLIDLITDRSMSLENFLFLSPVTSLIGLISEKTLGENKKLVFLQEEIFDRDELISMLLDMGYERVYRVYDKGEFSVKGSNIDIFDISKRDPLRFLFSEDKLEQIYTFDINKQERIKRYQSIDILPNVNIWQSQESGGYISLIELFERYVQRFAVIVLEPMELFMKLKSEIDIFKKSLAKESPNIECSVIDKDFLEKKRSSLRFDISSLDQGHQRPHSFQFLQTKSQKQSFSNPSSLLLHIQEDLDAKKKVILCINDVKRTKTISQLLTDHSISYEKMSSLQTESKKEIVGIISKELYRGFHSEKLSVYGQLDIYDYILSKHVPKDRPGKLVGFNPGDYVVHKVHGIGKYSGIVSRQIDGFKREYFLIEYANNDKLYTPTWQSEKIHKFIGDAVPKVSALNSGQWEKLKGSVRNSVKELAFDLKNLYAEREAAKGFAFSKDSLWLGEIEELFPFEETPDQKKAIEYVKRSMEAERPMDVLVCADVGFGKTEIAIRAAFKAAENGKQVLMLVPTTILADQHYHTFRERYRNHPVSLEVLSRFKNKKGQNRIVRDFSEGRIDVLIGTHRLLSDDIKPKDLGLLIVDEEQRFGVGSKEKIKLLKSNVDSLTLSATPIPRTLYMSLTGIRDMIQIKTHPENRHPIKTFVGRKSPQIIKQAMEREIARGGQIYYVYNNIEMLEKVMFEIKKYVPYAKIAITHGRMKGLEIERIMEDFINKKYDILLTTSIIESGMDIENVNTLIVENAHRFGLSQLYQLRGRVGRSSERAYAYLLYNQKDILNAEAFERLKTLDEYTELGSGYQIALKDLEIRGAGELLGAKQSGHLNSIGFELYCQIIKEEVEKLQGKKVQEDINVHIELPISAYIPKNYINNENERIDIYKEIGNALDFKELDALTQKIEDRYGSLSAVVKNLLYIARIKVLLKNKKIEKLIFNEKSGIIMRKIELERRQINNIFSKYKDLIYNAKNKTLTMKNFDKNMDIEFVFKTINGIIGKIKNE